MSRVTVRLATAADAEALWIWRNDERTRAMSRENTAVDWVDHRTWFERALADPQRTMYIGTLTGGERVGMCRFDVGASGAHAEVSLNVNPAMRGRKLAQPLLAAGIAHFAQTHTLPLHATIRLENVASIRCFEQCGFVRVRSDTAYAQYVLVPAREDV